MATMWNSLCVANGTLFNSSSPLLPLRFNSNSNLRFRRATITSMCVPENDVVVIGYGMTTVDFLATVDSFPKPDDKVRTTSFKVQGGGNAGNALTCAARLGLKPKLISKVGDDSQGHAILNELQRDAVDTSFVLVSKGGSSAFSYVLIDNQTKTRTSIYTPAHPPMMPDDQSQSTLLSAFNEARLVYFDGLTTDTALFIAQEAARNKIPILVEAESPKEGLDELLKLADFAVCSARFPKGVKKFRANGRGTVCGRFFLGTAERIPDGELIDTTGAGDAFIGAILYAICTNMEPEKMLPFAAQVAAAKCRALGARTGLPYLTDPRLAAYLC
nr:uncharacterized protein LOC112695137 isoform X2 [Arachis hypogaea]